ncbi:hypothetical protein EIK77_006189 [Talaromyces pinophilus]|nr:hypothetical protein EIK77_006189 [Talaromyces pinophilus]
MSAIQRLYPRIVALRPKLQELAEAEDVEAFKGLTRLFAEAGEAWVVLVARMPREFRGLVESVLECCVLDKEREAVSFTFNFWFELKQYLVLDRYAEAKAAYADIFSRLVDIMIKHLEFPTPEEGDSADLFDGDRAQEERFRAFRHSMGDVLKDCCAVIGVTECLMKAYQQIQQWVSKYASQATHANVPHWQELEAPLFSMRAMGRMVNPEESTVLQQVIPLIVQIPDHEKVRFSAIMALGRYTEWTANHPETLEAQLNYVISGFQHASQEVMGAAALAFKYLGSDCNKLLGGHIPQLHSFYESVLDKLKPPSQEEITEGVAAVVAVQPLDKIYESMKLFCDPIMARIMTLANNAQDEPGQRAVAAMIPLLPSLAQSLAAGFEGSREGCFLWATDAVVREFAEGAELVDAATSQAVYQFFEQQSVAFLRILNELPPEHLPDVIEDFFRLASDAIRFYPKECVTSSLVVPIFSAGLSALTLQQVDPLIATLHYYRDLLSFGFETPSISNFSSPDGQPYTNPPEVRNAVKELVGNQGQLLVERVLTGMMFSFPEDCFPDASGILMAQFELMPQQTGMWVQSTIERLPAGTMKPGEAERLLTSISEKIQLSESRKIRVLLQGQPFFRLPACSLIDSYNRFHQFIPTTERCTTRRPWTVRSDAFPFQRIVTSSSRYPE